MYGFGNWAQLSAQAIRRLCGSTSVRETPHVNSEVNTDLALRPPQQEAPGTYGTLQDVVRQGWKMRAPPAPDEPGPSNWQTRSLSPPTASRHEPILAQSEDFEDPAPLHNISQLINDRFRVSPLPLQDPLSRTGTAPTEELYSPSSPLLLSQLGLSSSDDHQSPMAVQQSTLQLVQGLPSHLSMFGGKKRRNGHLTHSHSHESVLPDDDNIEISRQKRRCRRLENREAKGAFNIWRPPPHIRFISKAITDTSLARALGVEPGETITSQLKKKRAAFSSPESASHTWFGKRTKATQVANMAFTTSPMPISTNIDSATFTTGVLHLTQETQTTNHARSPSTDAADPHQPPGDP